jgi:TetR/AcrR family transcriptional regulator, transcriptional repressor for nem operon
VRVSKEKAAENRERILNAAAALIRERGISGAGVDALTEAAGLTHGSLYSQFGSKDRLVAEAFHFALARAAENLEEAHDLKSYVALYLSRAHRDAPGKGCPLAALGCEMPRSSEAVKSAFTEGLRRVVDRISGLIGMGAKHHRYDEQALATVAAMVGALILSRAVDDPDLAEKILEASRKSLTASLRD